MVPGSTPLPRPQWLALVPAKPQSDGAQPASRPIPNPASRGRIGAQANLPRIGSAPAREGPSAREASSATPSAVPRSINSHVAASAHSTQVVTFAAPSHQLVARSLGQVHAASTGTAFSEAKERARHGADTSDGAGSSRSTAGPGPQRKENPFEGLTLPEARQLLSQKLSSPEREDLKADLRNFYNHGTDGARQAVQSKWSDRLGVKRFDDSTIKLLFFALSNVKTGKTNGQGATAPDTPPTADAPETPVGPIQSEHQVVTRILGQAPKPGASPATPAEPHRALVPAGSTNATAPLHSTSRPPPAIVNSQLARLNPAKDHLVPGQTASAAEHQAVPPDPGAGSGLHEVKPEGSKQPSLVSMSAKPHSTGAEGLQAAADSPGGEAAEAAAPMVDGHGGGKPPHLPPGNPGTPAHGPHPPAEPSKAATPAHPPADSEPPNNPQPHASVETAASGFQEQMEMINKQQEQMQIVSARMQLEAANRAMLMQGVRDLVKDVKDAIKDVGEAGHKA